MKKIVIIACLLCFNSHSLYSQKIESDDIQNGIRRIQSKSETIDIGNFFRYNLERFSDETGRSQYYIRGRSEENEYHNFPVNCKLLFKTFDGKVIELTSVISELVRIPHKGMFSTKHLIANMIWEPTAYYPITFEQLQDLFTGVAKIRVEMLSYDKKQQTAFMDYPELEFKKDKMGKQFKEMFNHVQQAGLKEVKLNKDKNKKKEKKEERLTLERKDAASDF